LKRHGAKEEPFDFSLVLIDAVKNQNEELIEQLFDYFENQNKIKGIDRSKLINLAGEDNKKDMDRLLEYAIEKSGVRGKLTFSQGHRPKEIKTGLVTDEPLRPNKKDVKNITP
jgi:hypothetical protein